MILRPRRIHRHFFVTQWMSIHQKAVWKVILSENKLCKQWGYARWVDPMKMSRHEGFCNERHARLLSSFRVPVAYFYARSIDEKRAGHDSWENNCIPILNHFIFLKSIVDNTINKDNIFKICNVKIIDIYVITISIIFK